MSSTLSANGPAVSKLLEACLPGFRQCCGNIKAASVDFELVQSAKSLNKKDLQACVDLIESTSGDDYRASSIGWSETNKKKEMKDPEMMYLLIREGNDSNKRKRASDVALYPSKQVKAAREKSATPQNHFDETCNSMSGNKENDEVKDRPNDASNFQAPCEPNPVKGFISFMFTYDDPPHEDREVVYIYEIHLGVQLRGAGLGSQLITFVEHAALGRSITKTMLTVFKSNEGARALYERLGYSKDACSPQDRIVRKRVIEADYIIMSKELSSPSQA